MVVLESRQGSDKALIRRILALYRHAQVTGAATGSEKSYKFSGVKLNLLINFDNGPILTIVLLQADTSIRSKDF